MLKVALAVLIIACGGVTLASIPGEENPDHPATRSEPENVVQAPGIDLYACNAWHNGRMLALWACATSESEAESLCRATPRYYLLNGNQLVHIGPFYDVPP